MSSVIDKQSKFDLKMQLNRLSAARERERVRESGQIDQIWKNVHDKSLVRKMTNLKKLNPNHKCTAITVANHKGGVCKTTTCFALAKYLFNAGNRVLVVDTDPQGSLSSKFNVSGDDPECRKHTLTSVYRDFDDFSAVVNIPIIVDGNMYSGVDPAILLLPGDNKLAPTVKYAESMNGDDVGCRNRFGEFIDIYREYFDYIIFDTTPLIEASVCSAHAISVSDCVIVPLYAVESVENIRWTVSLIRSVCKRHVKLLFTFPKYSPDDAELTREFEEKCEARRLQKCVEPVEVKQDRHVREPGYDERRNSVYRFMRLVLPYNTIVTGIPDVQRIGNGTYDNIDRYYKSLYDAMFREVVKKLSDGVIDNVCDKDVWDSTYAELSKYISIVNEYVTENTPVRVNTVEFEGFDE